MSGVRDPQSTFPIGIPSNTLPGRGENDLSGE